MRVGSSQKVQRVERVFGVGWQIHGMNVIRSLAPGCACAP